MITIITAIHIIVSVGLIFIVLLQQGKGADMGAVFGGGSSSTLFGASGAGNFLTRLTTGMAVVFMITSLTLGYFSSKRTGSSLFEDHAPQAGQPARSQTSPLPPVGRAAPLQAPQPPAQPAPAQQAAPEPQKPATP